MYSLLLIQLGLLEPLGSVLWCLSNILHFPAIISLPISPVLSSPSAARILAMRMLRVHNGPTGLGIFFSLLSFSFLSILEASIDVSSISTIFFLGHVHPLRSR